MGFVFFLQFPSLLVSMNEDFMRQGVAHFRVVRLEKRSSHNDQMNIPFKVFPSIIFFLFFCLSPFISRHKLFTCQFVFRTDKENNKRVKAIKITIQSFPRYPLSMKKKAQYEGDRMFKQDPLWSQK